VFTANKPLGPCAERGNINRDAAGTEAVRREIAAGETSFITASMAQDGDLAFGVVKKLSVEYRIDHRRVTASASDPEMIDLLDMEWSSIRDGTSGRSLSMRDVRFSYESNPRMSDS
jgi:hypothetical protein